jgi:predicted NBD/HSP70 family sugar kinase
MPFLGIDIGGTNIDIVLLEDSGEFRHLQSFKTSDKISEISEIIKDCERRYGIERSCVGVAAWIRDGKIVKAPNLPRVPKFDWLMENDANCFAFYTSKKLGFENMLGITVGTGIGSGIVIGGKIYRGRGLASEIGHVVVGSSGRKCVCGGKDHLEAYFGGWAIKKETGKEAKELFKLDESKVYEIKGFKEFCRVIGFAVMLMDFEAVIIGGRIGSRLDIARVKKEVGNYLMPEFNPKIVSINDELAVAKGAAMLAKEG